MKPQIPWLRVFVEGVVIVGSILLAFGIDAWWEERGERVEEQALLSSLLTEFEAKGPFEWTQDVSRGATRSPAQGRNPKRDNAS